MENTTHTPPDPDQTAKEARQAENALCYERAADDLARIVQLKAAELLERQQAKDPTAGPTRDLCNVVLAAQRIKEMNEHDLKPTASDDRDAIEHKRAEYLARVDKLLAEHDRQRAAERDAAGLRQTDAG